MVDPSKNVYLCVGCHNEWRSAVGRSSSRVWVPADDDDPDAASLMPFLAETILGVVRTMPSAHK